MTTKILIRKIDQILSISEEIRHDIETNKHDSDPFNPDLFKMLDTQLARLEAIEEILTLRDLENNDGRFYDLLHQIEDGQRRDG